MGKWIGKVEELNHDISALRNKISALYDQMCDRIEAIEKTCQRQIDREKKQKIPISNAPNEERLELQECLSMLSSWDSELLNFFPTDSADEGDVPDLPEREIQRGKGKQK